MFRRFLSRIILCILRLRYRVRVRGLKEIASRGTSGILFAPSHPALIDPIILLSVLTKDFAPRPLADADQVDRPVIRRLAKLIRARTIPDLSRYGPSSREQIERALAESIEGLKAGENLLLYPAGRLLRGRYENVAGNSAVETILKRVDGVRLVLVRTRGLWGSSFSWASSRPPNVAKSLRAGLKYLLLSGVFFAPKREVTIEFYEPEDFPRTGGRAEINKYIEDFFNADAPPNTYVPYTIWERGGPRTVPEPRTAKAESDARDVPDATRKIVAAHLKEITGRAELSDEESLSRDLGLDSLAVNELVVWLEKEFGFPAGDVYGLETVCDVMLAACGTSASSGAAEIEGPPEKWFVKSGRRRRAALPRGSTVTELFLEQARAAPGRLIIADETSGAKSYRDVVTAVLVLKDEVARLEGDRIAILMPASVAADVVMLAILFAGKTPVMVNWTTGRRNAVHSMDLVGVERVLTSRRLVRRLATQGIDLSELNERFVFLEDVARRVSWPRKLRAWTAARTTWRALRGAKVPETAVILFTSGSESLPKAVPLTHENLLANLRDVFEVVTIFEDDRLLGMLPPFHSFGLTATVLVPLCAGVPAAYWPNPTQGAMLARMIQSYSLTVVIGTPTFLSGIARAAQPEQTATLRLAVTGAEKCPRELYERLAEKAPGMKILEGYGVTECSPIISLNDERNPKQGTIGKVLPSFEYALVDADTGRRVPRGAAGVLLVRGPSVFGGYLNYDGESPFVEFEGKRWYRTGDLATEDASGVLTFRGRLKRFVKLGGEMISLPAIEAVLASGCGAQSEEGPVIAVEVTAHEQHPELVLFTTVDIDRAEANRHIRAAGLSALHNIRKVVRLDEIPVLGTGKTDYRALKAMLAEKSGESDRAG